MLSTPGLRRCLLAAALLTTVGTATAQALPSPPASAQPRPALEGHTFDLRVRAQGLTAPLWVGHAPGDRGALWVAQLDGTLIRLSGGRRTTRLSVASRILLSSEQGLLGVAFHPGYAKNRLVVLSLIDPQGNTRLELWRIGATAREGRLVRTLLKQPQPYYNHNGGHVLFGDGNTLYFGLGDGGSVNDPQRYAQNPDTRLGKLLRARVTATGRSDWEVVATGLRNPWRFSYDAPSRELWIGDVGQHAIEEIDRIPVDWPGLQNLGWGPFEGGRLNPDGGDALTGGGTLVWPVITYAHGEDGCSVTGGEVYRGAQIPRLRGRYVFGDFCSGRLWSVAPKGAGVGQLRRERATVPQLTSFGTDGRGELYAASAGGTIYRLIAAE